MLQLVAPSEEDFIAGQRQAKAYRTKTNMSGRSVNPYQSIQCSAQAEPIPVR